ncbi:MAG: flavohemoglobin expression-modulating QEGLA motif protein [Gammaproteobacteria bacterium CG_4_10_14_0_8_um_filter_38_16]|nr:MAG: flavohemoglobin expression-modulating QEGLA motif protein [Gammaproteobacteria bacterium CG_4_10_14_0_8_um_filter_38_16]PJA02757.1 MAG: flavohemoglobin expression-modulating QEGLA motif protein [Gammaproteobacteria bacterium CG_4_10_14_0_2_um_filter_38_22]PJB10755.1 MAG: flavohemoglobin expression-modulating QEGLA motif protein [Gammaproteobacteria bacterium CG_4_9_14_3_um_filter_38_9]
MNHLQSTTPEKQKIRLLSDRLVELQRPIRILDAIKWDNEIKTDFFKNKFQQLPKVDQAFYEKNPLPFNADDLTAQFHVLIREIKNELGQYSGISKIMIRLCEEYCQAILMIQSRGKPLFSELAMEMYGAPNDAFYPNGPRLSDMGSMLGKILEGLVLEIKTDSDEKRYTAEQAVEILQNRLSEYFHRKDKVTAILSDNIIADASAGADCIRLNQNVRFSDRDLRYLEVHEGWVHVGTTLNGLAQPICTFLAKGSPTSSITQEGLAVTTEIFTFSGYPTRMLKIMNRVRALNLVSEGANFIEVFRFFQQQGMTDDESYYYSVRVFRGSTPNGGPFTKDLSYTKGFLLIYNYIRLAMREGLIDRVPLFFVGKTLIEDIPTLYELKQQGLIDPPKYLPPQFQDLAALSSWMGFSLFLNQFDLDAVASHYGYILRK